MSNWAERAAENLIHLSNSNLLVEAMREWGTTGGYDDSHSVDQVCQLCEHEGLRYQFEIENKYTHNSLWVGSTCITKFIPLYNNGIEIVNEDEKANLLRKWQADFKANSREERAMSLLGRLRELEPQIFKDSRWRSKWRLGYSAKQLVMISIVSKNHSLPFNAADFRVNTRRQSNLAQLRALEAWQYRRLRGSLTKVRQTEFDQFFRD